MDVVIFAALPFVTDKELDALIGCAAQISTDRPWRSAEKESLLCISFSTRPVEPAPSTSPPKLNLIYRTGAQAKLVGLALIACSVRSYLRRKRSCTLAADTGDAALRELSA